MKLRRHLLLALTAFVLLEGGLRLFWEVPTQLHYIPQVGLMPTPNSTWVQNSEGPHWTTVNARGLNTHTAPTQPCAEMYILGDSMVSAYEVPRAQNFVSGLQRKLPTVSIVNAGFSGLSPWNWQPWVQYLEVPATAHIVLMLNWLDVVEILEEDPLAAEEPSVHKYVSAVLGHSAVVSALIKKIGLGPFGKERHNHTLTEPDTLFLTHTLQDILQNIRTQHPNISLVYLPDYAFSGRPLNVTRPNIDTQAEALIAKLTQPLNIPLFNLSVPMAAAIQHTGKIPVGFNHGWPTRGHLNAHGHHMVAKTLTPWLQNKVPHCGGIT